MNVFLWECSKSLSSFGLHHKRRCMSKTWRERRYIYSTVLHHNIKSWIWTTELYNTFWEFLWQAENRNEVMWINRIKMYFTKGRNNLFKCFCSSWYLKTWSFLTALINLLNKMEMKDTILNAYTTVCLWYTNIMFLFNVF